MLMSDDSAEHLFCEPSHHAHKKFKSPISMVKMIKIQAGIVLAYIAFLGGSLADATQHAGGALNNQAEEVELLSVSQFSSGRCSHSAHPAGF